MGEHAGGPGDATKRNVAGWLVGMCLSILRRNPSCIYLRMMMSITIIIVDLMSIR